MPSDRTLTVAWLAAVLFYAIAGVVFLAEVLGG